MSGDVAAVLGPARLEERCCEGASVLRSSGTRPSQ